MLLLRDNRDESICPYPPYCQKPANQRASSGYLLSVVEQLAKQLAPKQPAPEKRQQTVRPEFTNPQTEK